MKKLITGNEAVARGAYESGVTFASGYPGTPSTEILEEIAKYKGVQAEWSANEKVALDKIIGVSLSGRRSMAVMKHVGVNVASDTLMTLSYTGVNAGLVLVVVDDPGMYSSQNEQDSRIYAKFAKIPLLEPSDSQEAKDFVLLAFKISERYDTPVMIRLTARIAHTESVVEIKDNVNRRSYYKKFKHDPCKYVMVPANARKRRIFVEERLTKLEEFSRHILYNRIEWGSSNIAFVASGIVYQYAKEAFPEASFLKLGMTFPIPVSLVKSFTKKFKVFYIAEELDPFLEEQIKSAQITHGIGKKLFPYTGELNQDYISRALKRQVKKNSVNKYTKIDNSRSLLCCGCPYLGVFYLLKKMKIIAIGDIGCYALNVFSSYNSLATCISMGSSLGIASGLGRFAQKGLKRKVVSVIGDSTFFHSGLSALADIVYNKGAQKILILDNKAAAMTGGQGHPGTGQRLKGEKGRKIEFEPLIKAMGINRVFTVNSYNLKAIKEVLGREIVNEGISVVIIDSPCLLVSKARVVTKYRVLSNFCRNCKECLKLGCSALLIDNDQRVTIDNNACTGCSFCYQICPAKAIRPI